MRIGIAVSSRELRAVAVRRAGVKWAVVQELGPDQPLKSAFAELVSRIPDRRWVKPAASVAVGPAYVQVKPLSGVPPIQDGRALHALVAHNVDRFFVRTAAGSVTSLPWRDPDGRIWVAAYDEAVIRGVQAGCRGVGLRLRSIMPSVVAVAFATNGPSAVWLEDDIITRLTFQGRRVAAVRRTRGAPTEAIPRPEVVPALAPLGADAWRWAAAFGAVLVDAREPARLVAPLLEDSRQLRRRVVASAGLALLAASWFLAAPIIRATVDASRYRRQLSSVAPSLRDALAAEAALRQVDSGLTRLAHVVPPGSSRLELLARLTAALPESTVIVSISVDTVGGTATLLGRRASAAVARLETLPGWSGVQLMGPVLRQQVGGVALEQVSLRFGWIDARLNRRSER